MKTNKLYFGITMMLLTFLAIGSAEAQTAMNINDYRNTFNSHSTKMRVVTISDPSCGGCFYMVNDQLMPIFNDPTGCGLSSNIRYFFAWTDVLGATAADATSRANLFTDSRFLHYWDDDQLLGDLYLNTLSLVDPSGAVGAYTAWHTVMCYSPGTVWNVSDPNPPMPDFWMHKLGTTYNAPQNIYYTDADFTTGFSAIACAVSVNEYEIANDLSIYPNPSTSNVTINYDGKVELESITIYDALGATVRKVSIDAGTKNIKIEGLNNGLFYCKMKTVGNVMITKKFTVLK